MNIIYLERQLRAGKTPDELGGKVVGEGVQKKAYIFTTVGNARIIVKARQVGYQTGTTKAPKGIIKYGAKQVRSYRAGAWSIQEAVTVLRNAETREWNVPKEMQARWHQLYCAGLGDLHEYNCGVNSQGELVVFDW